MTKVYLGATGLAFMLVASFFALQNTSQSPVRSLTYGSPPPRVAGAEVQLAATSITPSFTTSYSLTVMKTGTGSGTVTSSPAGLSCGLSCAASYVSGTVITLTATPAAGSTFAGFSGCSPVVTATLVSDTITPVNPTCAITLGANASVVASFAQAVPTAVLSVTKRGTGSGTITSTPAGINCGSSCSTPFVAGSTVTLTITPTTGSKFTSWSGCSNPTGGNTCIVDSSSNPNTNPNVIIEFTATPVYTLTGYTISQTQTGLNWRSTLYPADTNGYMVYRNGTLISTITGESNYQYDAGGGARYWYNDSGLSCGTTYSYYMQGVASGVKSNTSSIATGACAIPTATYSIALNPSGANGSIVSTPAGISCSVVNSNSSGTCGAKFAAGTIVTLTATPASGGTFAGWSTATYPTASTGGCTGTSPTCTLTMNQNYQLGAVFYPSTTTGSLSIQLSSDTPPITTVSPGQTGVKFLKLNLTNNTPQPSVLQGIRLTSDVLNPQNLVTNTSIKAYDGTTQVGSSDGFTWNSEDGTYAWVWLTSPYLTLSPGASKTITIQADVWSGAGGSFKLGVNKITVDPGGYEIKGLPVWSQMITVSESTAPALYVSLDTSTPASATIQPSQTSIAFTNIKLTARNADISLPNLIIGANDKSTGGLTNIRACDASVCSSKAVSSSPNYYGQSYDVVFPSPLNIASGTSKILRLMADTTATASGIIHLSVIGFSSFTPSNTNFNPIGELPIYGNKMYVSSPVANPDLVITNVQVNNAFPSNGTTPKVGDTSLNGTVTVKNQGTGNAYFGSYGLTVGAYIHASPLDASAIEVGGSGPAAVVSGDGLNIPPGESRTYTFGTMSDSRLYTSPEFLGTAGSKMLYFMVDPSNVTSDTVRSNNVLNYTLNVLPASGSTTTSLRIVSPNGGETYKIGNTLAIKWDASNFPVGSMVYIELRPYGSNLSSVTKIAAVSPTGGYYSWQVPSTIVSGQYIIEVYQADQNGNIDTNESVKDVSDAPFTITSQTMAGINIITPQGGEQWQVGKKYTVGWGTANIPQSYLTAHPQLKLVDDQGYGHYLTQSQDTMVGADDSRFGRMTVDLTNPGGLEVGHSYRVSIPLGDLTTLSNGLVTIVSSITPRSCSSTPTTVSAGPLGNSTFGSLGLDISTHPEILKYRIQWSGGWSDWYTPGVDDVDWKTNDNGTLRRVWAYFGDHMHEIQHCSLPEPYNYNIRLLSPNGGEEWQAGTSHQVLWQGSNLPLGTRDGIGINLVNGYGTAGIFGWLHDDGNEQWTVPVTIEPGQYKLEVVATDRWANTIVASDRSDSPFTISAPSSSTSSLPPQTTVSLTQITTDAHAVTNGDTASLSTSTDAEQASLQQRAQEIITKIQALQAELASITPQLKDFIALGTPTTQKLGLGERAGVVSSFTSAFGKAPSSEADWSDVIKIANGRWPTQRSDAKEQQATTAFTKIYKRAPARDANAHDDAAVTVIAYGLRPADRNLKSETAAIKSFKAIYSHAPASATDWDTVRAIAYSGARR